MAHIPKATSDNTIEYEKNKIKMNVVAVAVQVGIDNQMMEENSQQEEVGGFWRQ